MKKLLVVLALSAFCLLPAVAGASTVVLGITDPNTPPAASYKAYYSTTNTQPFTGTGATQGASPVVLTAGSTTGTLSGLDPTKTYYFAVTAVNTAGQESAYSNIVTLPPFPSAPSVTLKSATQP